MPPPPKVSWVPPDGGWAWVIAVCSFLLHAMTVGTQLSMSVLYVSWLETFVDGRGITSWIISISIAVTFGMWGYATLVAVTTADVMGLTKATNSYGLLLAFMGLATLTGPPFAGLLFDWTQSYTVSYVLYGFFLICSMLMLIPIYCMRMRKKREEEHTVKEMSSSPLPHKQEHTENQTFQEAHKVS